MIDPTRLLLRDFNLTDLDAYLNYFYHSPKGFLASIAVDFDKFPTESFMRTRMTDICHKFPNTEGSRNPALSLIYDRRPVGLHPLNELTPGDSGGLHAHIFQPEMRKQGLASLTLVPASKLFIERFRLKRLLYKIPIQNTGALRMVEKLEIREIGKEVLNSGIVIAGTRVRVFELQSSEVDLLLKRHKLQVRTLALNQWGLAKEV